MNGNNGPPLEVKVWGNMACFTRPEMKVERVSYQVITPSAARGILESIFWKPQFRWVIREIAVLKAIRFFSILRNEVTSRASIDTARSWLKNGGRYFADGDRAQRHTLALRDVAYTIRADIELSPDLDGDVHPAKYRDQFRRRVANGRCHSIPYLGCREFAASFAPADISSQPIDLTEDLGRMLLDIDYEEDGSGEGIPIFFDARIERGVLRVPPLFVERGR